MHHLSSENMHRLLFLLLLGITWGFANVDDLADVTSNLIDLSDNQDGRGLKNRDDRTIVFVGVTPGAVIECTIENPGPCPTIAAAQKIARLDAFLFILPGWYNEDCPDDDRKVIVADANYVWCKRHGMWNTIHGGVQHASNALSLHIGL